MGDGDGNRHAVSGWWGVIRVGSPQGRPIGALATPSAPLLLGLSSPVPSGLLLPSG